MKFATSQKALLACLFLAVLTVPAVASTYYFPQVAVGAAGDLEIRTLLTISNPLSKNITVVLATYHNDGSAWVIDWEARDRPDLSGPRSDFSLGLQPGATVTMLAKSTGAIVIGWMGGRSNFPGVLTLRYSVARVTGDVVDPQWEVGVLPAAGLNQYSLSVLEGASDWNGCITSTAIAVANTAQEEATLTLDLFPYGGVAPAHTRTVIVPPNGHLAQFLPEIFENVFTAAAFRGMLQISSNTAVAVTTLQNWVIGADSVYAGAGAIPYHETRTSTVFDQEPTDAPGQGEYVRAPAEVVGVLSYTESGPDVDVFRVYVDAPGALGVVSLADVLGSPLKPQVELLAEDGQTVLGTSSTFLPGFGSAAFQVTIQQEGWYWLRVSAPGIQTGRSHFYRIFVGVNATPPS